MENLLLGIIIGILAHKLWVKLVVWYTLREMKQAGIDIDALLEEAEDDDKSATMHVRLEFDRDQYFLYNADTQTFMAQKCTFFSQLFYKKNFYFILKFVKRKS